MFKFIHAADIHLDSPLRGLMHYDSAPVERIQSATREAFKNLILFALDEKVDFVLIAGDLWDCDWADSGAGLFFISQAKRLARAGIKLFVVKGNHDAHSQLTTAIRTWGGNVTIFSHRKPQTVTLDTLGVAIHGQSYATQHIADDLSAAYPAPVRGAFNIGLLHTCLEGGGTDYAPACLEKLVASGYGYWALGHLHERQDLSRDGVHIVFPGNLQGRSIRETGAKGCVLVTVADDHSLTSRFEALDVVRWQEITVKSDDDDIETNVRQALDQASLASCGRLLAVRLHVKGSVTAGQALRDRLTAVAVEAGDIWLEKIVVVADPDRLSSPLLLDAEIHELIASLATDDGKLSEWMGEFARLRAEFTGELANTDGAKALNDTNAFRTLVAQVGGRL